jgi:hypothetical protein
LYRYIEKERLAAAARGREQSERAEAQLYAQRQRAVADAEAASERVEGGGLSLAYNRPRVYASSQLFNVNTVASPSSPPAGAYHLLTIVNRPRV